MGIRFGVFINRKIFVQLSLIAASCILMQYKLGTHLILPLFANIFSGICKSDAETSLNLR